MSNEEWERLTNCEKLRCRLCDLDVSESTSNKLFFELANIEDEMFEQIQEIERLNNIINKAIEELKSVQKGLEEAEGYYYDWLDDAINILKGVDKK